MSGRATIREPATSGAVVTHVRPRMGTLLALTLPRDAPDANARYVRAAFEIARACEHAMSRHDPDSDLNRLHRLAVTSPARGGIVSPVLAVTLQGSRALAERTDGAFDPTVGTLLALWRDAALRGRPPSSRALRTASGGQRWNAIDVRGARVSLRGAGIEIDLGGIGKGVALDLIAARLRRLGCAAAMLNFGESSLVAIGEWRVSLRDLRDGFVGEFTLRDLACSTSSTHGQSLRIGRRPVSHVLDPRSGRPLRRRAQVTVVARSAAVAEALSTACLVLGRRGVAEIARTFRAAACWIDRTGRVVTPRWPLTIGHR